MIPFQQEINIADYIITDELHKSCSHASNRYQMYIMERQTKDQEPEKVRRRKALQDDLVSAKKRKTELQVTAQNLVHSADEKAKDAVKRTDAAALRALLIRVQCITRKISRDPRERSPKGRREN